MCIRDSIAIINKKPLLYYTFKQAFRSKYIDKYIVSTECEEIMAVCKKYNVEYHKRPLNLAKDSTTSASALIDVTKNYSEYDIVVELMATNPLKKAKDIDSVIEKLINTNSDSVVSVVRIWDNHPSRVKYIENDRLHSFYPEIAESRRQDLTPAAYVRNGSIYATTIDSLMKNKVRLGPNTRPYIMSEDNTINIDEPRDLELARVIMK